MKSKLIFLGILLLMDIAHLHDNSNEIQINVEDPSPLRELNYYQEPLSANANYPPLTNGERSSIHTQGTNQFNLRVTQTEPNSCGDSFNLKFDFNEIRKTKPLYPIIDTEYGKLIEEILSGMQEMFKLELTVYKEYNSSFQLILPQSFEIELQKLIESLKKDELIANYFLFLIDYFKELNMDLNFINDDFFKNCLDQYSQFEFQQWSTVFKILMPHLNPSGVIIKWFQILNQNLQPSNLKARFMDLHEKSQKINVSARPSFPNGGFDPLANSLLFVKIPIQYLIHNYYKGFGEVLLTNYVRLYYPFPFSIPTNLRENIIVEHGINLPITMLPNGNTSSILKTYELCQDGCNENNGPKVSKIEETLLLTNGNKHTDKYWNDLKKKPISFDSLTLEEQLSYTKEIRYTLKNIFSNVIYTHVIYEGIVYYNDGSVANHVNFTWNLPKP